MSVFSEKRMARRATAVDTTSYAFAVGEIVKLKNDFLGRFQKCEIFRVVATLPPLGEAPQYRIRSEEESHDRVTTQDRLERMDSAYASGVDPQIERAFPSVAIRPDAKPRSSRTR